MPAVLLGPDSDVAEVQVCEVDSWILVEVGAGPNGTDASRRSGCHPRLRGPRSSCARWKVPGDSRAAASIAEWAGRTSVPARVVAGAAWRLASSLSRRIGICRRGPERTTTGVSVDRRRLGRHRRRVRRARHDAGAEAERGDGAGAAVSVGGGHGGGRVGPGRLRQHRGVGVHVRGDARRRGGANLSRRSDGAGVRTILPGRGRRIHVGRHVDHGAGRHRRRGRPGARGGAGTVARHEPVTRGGRDRQSRTVARARRPGPGDGAGRGRVAVGGSDGDA